MFLELGESGFYEYPGIIIAEPDGSLVPLDTEVHDKQDKSHLLGYEDFWGEDVTIIFYHKLIMDGLLYSGEGLIT
jgi:hypothetical protein